MRYLAVLIFVGLTVASFDFDSTPDEELRRPAYLHRTPKNLERAWKASNYLATIKSAKIEEVEIPQYITERDIVTRSVKRSVVGPETGDVMVIGMTTALTGAQLPYSTEQFSYITFAVNY